MNINQTKLPQEEKTVFDLPISEIERQCQAYQVKPPFDERLSYSQEPMDTVIEGGNKILNDLNTLRLVRKIYNPKLNKNED